MQPRLGGKQKTGKQFLQLVSVIKAVFIKYREPSQTYENTSHSPIDKWSKDMNRQFSEEEIKVIYSHMEKASESLLIREMQIKTTL